jgi:hypothetical protein
VTPTPRARLPLRVDEQSERQPVASFPSGDKRAFSSGARQYRAVSRGCAMPATGRQLRLASGPAVSPPPSPPVLGMTVEESDNAPAEGATVGEAVKRGAVQLGTAGPVPSSPGTPFLGPLMNLQLAAEKSSAF